MEWMDHSGNVDGSRVRQARIDCGLTLQQLAEAVGISVQALGNVERENAQPSAPNLWRIAQATKRDIAWFFQDEDASAPREKPLADTASDEPASQQASGTGDMQSLLAQLVAAQAQMAQAQARAEERLAEMSQALTALAHEQIQARAESARMQRRLLQVEADLRETEEGDDAGCCPGQEACSG